MNKQCETELMTAQTMQDVFNTITKYYDLQTAPLTFVTRLTVISGIKTAIKLTSPKEK